MSQQSNTLEDKILLEYTYSEGVSVGDSVSTGAATSTGAGVEVVLGIKLSSIPTFASEFPL
jgi:hypothetical protein